MIMNSNIDINLRSIKPFENIKDENLLKIKKESELLQFSMGTTISTLDIIPNKILLILLCHRHHPERCRTGRGTF